MNLYEYEGKQLFAKYGIKVPSGVLVRPNDNFLEKYNSLQICEVVVKAQVVSGKRGKNNGIKFCSSGQEVVKACEDLFNTSICGQQVSTILIEEKLAIAEEHYVSITYDTNQKQPLLIYSSSGGMEIEDVAETNIHKEWLNITVEKISSSKPFVSELWGCFLKEDARLVEINPLIKTTSGQWYAADAKVALDDDAFYRHKEWENFEPRTMMGRNATEREIAVKKIDEGEKYYQGTAGKYIEFDGDIAVILNGGGASIANMDALMAVGLKPANYTEYSGNPPREKVYQLAKIVLSKSGIRGLWMCGVVANFTNIKETFLGIIDALDELKPQYPIVVRRDGPDGEEARLLMEACAKRNGLNMKVFGKEMNMSETASVLASMINK